MIKIPLNKLKPRFLDAPEIYKGNVSFKTCKSVKYASGIVFKCPKCFWNNKKRLNGVHSVICWTPHVPQTIEPIPGRWNLIGNSLEDVSLVQSSSSVALQGNMGCQAHFFVKYGMVELLNA